MSIDLIRQRTNQDIRQKAAEGSIKREDHAEINDMICNELEAVKSMAESASIGSKDWYTTSTMVAPTKTLGAVTSENPVIDLTLTVKRSPGQTGDLTFDNLKLANGDAADSITITEVESNQPFPFLVYNAASDEWSKDIRVVDIPGLIPTPGLEELFAPESELGSFTLKSDTHATFVLVKPVTFKMTEFKVQAITAGAIRFAAFSRVGTVTTRLRYVDVTLTVGINTINLELNPGEYIGWYQNPTTFPGRVGYKTVPGVYTYTFLANIEVTSTATHTGWPTGTNLWFAISTGYPRTFADTTNKLDTAVNDLSEDVATNIKPAVAEIASTPGLEELFAPVSELGSFTGGTIFSGTAIMLKAATFNMKTFKVQCTTAGTIRFAAFSRVGTVTTRLRYVDAVLTLGINEVTLVVNTGEYLGFYENASTHLGRIGQKTIAGVYTYQLFNGIDVTSATHTGYPTGNNVWFAISTGYARSLADNLTIVKSDISSIQAAASNYTNKLVYNLETPLASISRHSKRLVKGVVVSDSLWGNGDPINFGGPLPGWLAMPDGENPMRGTYYNLFMRAYGTLCHGRPSTPKNRRINHADWSSTGTWTAINNNTIWEPGYANETYHFTTSPNASKTITIPAGCESIGLILREASGCASVDFSLNGGSIAAYGPSSFDTDYANVGHTGNPYRILEWHDVPTSGSNTFTLTKDNTSDPLYVWGAIFWTGNTVILINMSHGGHTLGDILAQHWADEYVRNNWDFTIFQLTELNDTRVNNLPQSVANLKTMLDVIQLKDCITMSCIPFGGELFSTTYPGQRLFNEAFKKEILDRKLPFIDNFTLFERAIISMGRTPEDGGAEVFQWDKQHYNNKGHDFQDAPLQTIYKRTPIYA